MNKRNKVNILVFSLMILIIAAFFIFLNFNKAIKKSPDSDCIIINENLKSINVVFLSYKHNNKEDFMKSVNSYVYGQNGFSNIEPFKSNFDKFSFYAVYTDSVICEINQGTLLCEDSTAKKIASKCPNDYIFVLTERNSFLDAVAPVRSSAYLNLGSINTADHELVVVHEFGHLFGKLVDEYWDDSSYKGLSLRNAPNCDDKDCKKWMDFNGTQCLKGCALSSYYRSQDFTIMRNYFKSNKFGVYNEWLLNKLLQ